MDGINQIHVNPTIGLTFAAGLRHIVRQDPDVIMVGEIRDRETADIAIRAALTGHLVFSTLHTNDAPSAITRLIENGRGELPGDVIAGGRAGAAPGACDLPHCKESAGPALTPAGDMIETFRGAAARNATAAGTLRAWASSK